MSKKSFIGGTIILMAAGFIVRILGFVYRIYLSNLIGAEGMGLFQLIMPVYSLIILTLTSGISIAVSKMVASEMAKKHNANLIRITACALIISAAAGAVISGLIFINVRFIADFILKDGRTYHSLMLLVPCIPVIAAAAAIKGYFYGTREVMPTAVSQVAEQVVKIGLVVVLAAYFVNIGLEYACALATIGMALGEICNLAVLYFVYHFKKKKLTANCAKSGIMRKRDIIKNLLVISLPISFNRFIASAMSALEVILIPRRLIAGGLDYQSSISEYGRLTGMAMPLIFFPSLVTSSLATTIVPAISEAISLKQYKSVNYRISKSIQLTFILGFIFTVIFMAYPKEIGEMVYRKEDIGEILYFLSFSCTFTYLQQTLLGILNGLGKQAVSLRNSIIGNSIRICFVYFFIPIYGIKGYTAGIIISSALVCSLNIYSIIRTTGMAVDIRNWIVKPGMVAAVMVFISKYIYGFFMIFNAGHTWTVFMSICGNAAVSAALMVAAGALDRDEVFKVFVKMPANAIRKKR